MNCSCCPNNPFAELLAERGFICSLELQKIYYLLLETVPSLEQQQELAKLFNITAESFPPPQGEEFKYGECHMLVRVALTSGNPQLLDELRTAGGYTQWMTHWSLHRLFRERAIKHGRLNC